jgi:peptidyl-tRNA hydrolase, PTH1 family
MGPEYHHTRHNIGFSVLDAFAEASNTIFSPSRYGDTLEMKVKGKTLILLKPSTYVNLSGKAVNYWLQKENIPIENLLVVTDDLALPFGTIRLRPKGGDAGHNGLKSIQELIGTTNYARLRFGIGNDFPTGRQVDYVLGKWNTDEKLILTERLKICVDTIKSFALSGVNETMNQFNNK